MVFKASNFDSPTNISI